MAVRLRLSLSCAIGLLSELGIQSAIEHDDSRASYTAARSLAADAPE